MDNTILVDSFPKNTTEVIGVGISQYKGRDLIFIRSFAQSIDGDGLIPTQKGVTLNINKWSELYSGIIEISTVMSSDKEVAHIQKNKKQEIRIGVNKFKNIPLVYIRTFVKFNETDEFKPTKKGVSLRIEQYPQLLESLKELDKAVKELIGK